MQIYQQILKYSNHFKSFTIAIFNICVKSIIILNNESKLKLTILLMNHFFILICQQLQMKITD